MKNVNLSTDNDDYFFLKQKEDPILNRKKCNSTYIKGSKFNGCIKRPNINNLNRNSIKEEIEEEVKLEETNEKCVEKEKRQEKHIISKEYINTIKEKKFLKIDQKNYFTEITDEDNNNLMKSLPSFKKKKENNKINK